MAVNTGVYTGESGVIKFVGDDSTVAAVASIRSFTIERGPKYRNNSYG